MYNAYITALFYMHLCVCVCVCVYVCTPKEIMHVTERMLCVVAWSLKHVNTFHMATIAKMTFFHALIAMEMFDAFT